jgi:hypothetical protein
MNYFLLWAVWNSVNGGYNYNQIKQHYIDFCAKLNTDYPNNKIVIVSAPVTNADYPTGQGLVVYNSIRDSFNSEGYSTDGAAFGADGFAAIHLDPIIGDSSPGTDPDYWIGSPPELHGTAALYARAAVYVADKIAEIT